MRQFLLSAALIALAACSPHAGAFAGSADLQPEPGRSAPNRSAPIPILPSAAQQSSQQRARTISTIRLVANQFVAQGPSTRIQAKPGESAALQVQLVAARENCTGDLNGLQFDITCAMAAPLAHYTPDNFSLQASDADTLSGVLTSGEDQAQATFTRVR